MIRLWFALCIALFLAGCGSPASGSPEAAFEEAVEAVEQASPEKLEALLAADFAGDSSRETTMAYARQWFSRSPKVRITVLDQKKQGDNESVTFRSQVLVSSGGGLIPERSSRLQVDTQWKMIDGQWKLRVAQWNRVR